MIVFKNPIRVLSDNTGASTIEMAMICATIVLAMLGALQGFADESAATWTTISTEVETSVQKSIN